MVDLIPNVIDDVKIVNIQKCSIHNLHYVARGCLWTLLKIGIINDVANGVQLQMDYQSSIMICSGNGMFFLCISLISTQMYHYINGI